MGLEPIGLDIGAQTSEFARPQGATVRRLAVADYTPRRRLFDAVFIWNCFEQLEHPRRGLREARRVLNRHGLVILRVPNGNFYRHHFAADGRWLQSLAYNNMLGFPYLNGFSVQSLEWLLRSADFEPIRRFATSLLTPPYPDMSAQVHEEWGQVKAEAERASPEASPWIEVVAQA